VDVHFIHVRSASEHALPLVVTHGWPGSVIEMLDVIEPLTDPAAHGGSADDAFDLVIPSLPGYGLSSKPSEIGWIPPVRVAKAWAGLMQRLGYDRYVAQGGDVGAAVTHGMGLQAPDGLVGIHTNLFFPALAGAELPEETDEEKAGRAAIDVFKAGGFGYFLEQATRPQTIGYAILDSPIALAAWLADHDTDAYYKIASAFVDEAVGEPHARQPPRQHHAVLADGDRRVGRAVVLGGRPELPAGRRRTRAAATGLAPGRLHLLPGEIWRTPRSWVETAYPDVVYYNQVDRGGHFAAWEEPELFSEEVRAAFRSVR
jgi:pimeloyl-ACP methyl ester carboxylesterase